ISTVILCGGTKARSLPGQWHVSRRADPDGRTCGHPARHHHNARANVNTGVEVDDVSVGQPYAAGGHERANGRWLIGAMETVRGIAEIKRACAERIAWATGHETRQIGLTIDHLFRRAPVWPPCHSRDFFGASPSESFATDANAVA